MADTRSIDLEWQGFDGAETVATSAGSLPDFVVRQLSPGATTPGPEALLLAAIASSYGIALANLLDAAALPRGRTAVRVSGTITGDHGKARFTRMVVTPNIRGADLRRQEEYRRAANTARDECIIGRSVRGSVALVVGDVTLFGE
jgi:organic hydroperoxide reductase OsmC/OhrA